MACCTSSLCGATAIDKCMLGQANRLVAFAVLVSVVAHQQNHMLVLGCGEVEEASCACL